MKVCQKVINCTDEEAMKIGESMGIDSIICLKEAAKTLYNKHLAEDGETKFAEYCAISDIFVMGYVSGVRAERAKKNANK
jgi:Trk K+ transport system NAD-binding subunit